jgi:hypothetical protein
MLAAFAIVKDDTIDGILVPKIINRLKHVVTLDHSFKVIPTH